MANNRYQWYLHKSRISLVNGRYIMPELYKRINREPAEQYGQMTLQNEGETILTSNYIQAIR